MGEKHVSNYCPAKLANTKFSIYEANGEKDKAKYYYDGNKEYSMSPAAGFVPNKKVVEKNKKIMKYHARKQNERVNTEKIIHSHNKTR